VEKVTGKWRWALALAMLLASVSVVGRLTVRGVRSHRACSPTFDEAVHILPAAQIADDLRRLDVVAFLRHSYHQGDIALYPFFHSWLLSPSFLAVGTSLTVGRVANVLLVCLSMLVAFFLAGELSPREEWRWWAGLIGAGMVLSAMPLWVYASRVYLAPAGLLLTLCVLFCYVKAPPEYDGRFWLVCSSLLTAAGFFTKYSFGLFILGGLILSEGAGWLMTRRRPVARWLYLFGPCALLFLLWFANPEKLQRFWIYSRSQNPNMEPWSVASLTYYLRSLLRVYATTPLTLGLTLLGVGYGAYHVRRHRYRAPLGYFLASLVMVTLVPQKNHRFNYTIAPVAMMLGGAGAVWVTARLFEVLRTPAVRYGAAVLIVLLVGLEIGFVVHRFSFLSAAQDMVYACPPSDVQAAYQFILDHTLAQNIRPRFLNHWHTLNHYGLVWEYCAAGELSPGDTPYQLATAGLAPEPTPENLDRLMQELREGDVGMLVSIDGSPAGSYTGWQAVEPLWARGDVEWVASSEQFTVVAWSDAYEGRVLAGSFWDWADLETARSEGLKKYSIRVHLYSVVTR
jgi:hypothetical protein